MTENDQNRRWLLSSTVSQGPAVDADTETLMYYKAQLEAELQEVTRRLASLGVRREPVPAR